MSNGWIELIKVAWLPVLALIIFVVVGNKTNSSAQRSMNRWPLAGKFMGCGVMVVLNILFVIGTLVAVLWLLVQSGWSYHG